MTFHQCQVKEVVKKRGEEEEEEERRGKERGREEPGRRGGGRGGGVCERKKGFGGGESEGVGFGGILVPGFISPNLKEVDFFFSSLFVLFSFSSMKR